jgi:hypothetical protein
MHAFYIWKFIFSKLILSSSSLLLLLTILNEEKKKEERSYVNLIIIKKIALELL